MACLRASSSREVYSLISPPPSERRPAMILPPRPRLRTTTPKTCPLVSTIRCRAIPSVVTIRIFFSFSMVRAGILHTERHKARHEQGSPQSLGFRRADLFRKGVPNDVEHKISGEVGQHRRF